MLSPSLLQRLWDLSDDFLYPEAVKFVRDLVNRKGCSPLPTSQVMGLLSIAKIANYSKLMQFIQHQRDRNWPESKKDIKTFYIELELWFIALRNRLVRKEFRLLSEGLRPIEANREVDEIMATLAREFIQHLVAENLLLTTRRPSGQRSRNEQQHQPSRNEQRSRRR